MPPRRKVRPSDAKLPLSVGMTDWRTRSFSGNSSGLAGSRSKFCREGSTFTGWDVHKGSSCVCANVGDVSKATIDATNQCETAKPATQPLMNESVGPNLSRKSRTTNYVLASADRSAAFSAIMIATAFVLDEIRRGMTELSQTRRRSMPRTLSFGSTTESASPPMRQVPAG
jgi:hypothetical protein